MFARVCEVHFKPEKRAELFRMVREEIVPMLEKFDGFFDEIALDLDTSEKVLCHFTLARRARRREISEGMLPKDL
jgi:hypothetical protein